MIAVTIGGLAVVAGILESTDSYTDTVRCPLFGDGGVRGVVVSKLDKISSELALIV